MFRALLNPLIQCRIVEGEWLRQASLLTKFFCLSWHVLCVRKCQRGSVSHRHRFRIRGSVVEHLILYIAAASSWRCHASGHILCKNSFKEKRKPELSRLRCKCCLVTIKSSKVTSCNYPPKEYVIPHSVSFALQVQFPEH